jgi:hypothetical protein
MMQSGGMLLFYQLQQCSIQYRMQQVLNNGETTFEKLTLILDDYAKSKISRDEIRLNGKMYDVRSVKFLKGKVELLAVCDMEEEDILEKINKLLKHSTKSKNSVPGYLISLSSLAYISPYTDHDFLFHETSRNIFHPYSETVTSRCPDIAFPPPKLS